MFKRAKTKLNILPVSFKRNGKHYSNNKLFKQDQKDLKKLQTELSKKSIKPNDLKSNNYFKGKRIALKTDIDTLIKIEILLESGYKLQKRNIKQILLYFKSSKTYFLKVGFLLYRNIIFMVLKIMKINF